MTAQAYSQKLRVAGLGVSYGTKRALDGLSLEVGSGEIVCLLGANGAGKTSALRAVSGLVSDGTTGEVRLISDASSRVLVAPSLAGRSLQPDAIARLGVLHCPEGRGPLPELTVRENLELGRVARPPAYSAQWSTDWEAALSLFPRLRERLSAEAGTLSGGELQMLTIARALLARPRFLLLDEPSLGLAPKLVTVIFETLTRIARDGVGILLVEQNAMQALRIANRAVVLELGRTVLQGDAKTLAADPRVRDAYL